MRWRVNTHRYLIRDNGPRETCTDLVCVDRVEIAEANGADEALRFQLGQYLDRLKARIHVGVIVPMELRMR